MHSGIVFRGWQQHSAIAYQWNSEERRVIAEGPEQYGVVAAAMLPQMIEQTGYRRPVLAKPFLLVGAWRLAVEDLLAQRPELVQAPLARDGEPDHMHRAICRFACRILVVPGDVIARAGGENGDVVRGSQPLPELPAVQLRAAGDVGAVALNDESELHWRLSLMARMSRRSRAFSIASSCTQANSTSLTRR